MSLFLIFLFNYFFTFIEGNNFLNLLSKSSLRKLWEEEPSYRDVVGEEKESIDDYCKGPYTDYKYNVFYEVGKNYTFTEDKNLIDKNNINADALYTKIIEDNWGDYFNRVGLFFIFVACAGVSIIVWIFNWVCWLNQCCCCDFLHNPVNKRIAWWISFSFLLSILACCISAFVIVNRFGFALNGAMCAFDRIYYDTLNGQLKKEGEKWEGLKNTAEILDYIEDLCIFIEDKNIEIEDSFLKKWCKDNKFQKDNRKLKKGIPGFDEDSQKKIKERIKFEYFHDQYKLLYAFLKVISMICYCLLLIAATASGVSMMFYACLKRQGYLITFMHVFWNIIRFFIVSFFLYGTAYGIFFLILKDLISCANKIFSEYLLKDIDINNEAYIDEENKKICISA